MNDQAEFGIAEISNLIKKIGFFDVFTSDEFNKLMEIGEWFKVPSGKRIITKGDSDNYMYILAQGQVEIILGCKVLGKLKSGDMFGEFGLIGTVRTASVEAVTDCMLMAFRGDHLNDLPPEIQIKFLKQVIHVICNHLQHSNKSLWFRAPVKDMNL